VITFNGLEMEEFYSVEDMAIKHISSRERIKEFLKYFFFPYYPINIDRPLFFYTTGRPEFRNKGCDILIKSLARLNETLKSRLISGELKKSPDFPGNIFFFFWIPMQHYGMRMDVLENQEYYMHIKGLLETHSQEIMTRLLYDFISKKDYNDGLFTENFLREIKKDLIAFERNGLPPLSTHNMDENSNMLMRSLKENGLLNRKDDIVKIIIEPIYLDGTDAFIGLNNYDAMAGCHLGVFPSYYEPWGYTPLESISLAVPAVTTDLAGFGMFVKSNDLQGKGIYVLDRFERSDDEAVEMLFKIMLEFSSKSHDARVDFKIKAKRISELADWKKLVENYITAYKLAVRKALDRTG
jgi:glycogen(starch) synthase